MYRIILMILINVLKIVYNAIKIINLHYVIPVQKDFIYNKTHFLLQHVMERKFKRNVILLALHVQKIIMN